MLALQIGKVFVSKYQALNPIFKLRRNNCCTSVCPFSLHMHISHITDGLAAQAFSVSLVSTAEKAYEPKRSRI